LPSAGCARLSVDSHHRSDDAYPSKDRYDGKKACGNEEGNQGETVVQKSRNDPESFAKNGSNDQSIMKLNRFS
jgi:hypothetical protein